MQELKFDEKDIRKIFRTDTASARFFRFAKSALVNLIYLGILFGIFFYALNFPAFLKRFQYEAKAKPVISEPIKQPDPVVEIPDYAPLLEIPKLGISAPIHMSIASELIVDQLRTGVAHFESTAFPGEIGNSVIVGHSSDLPWSDGQYKTVFALLDKLVVGDKIVVFYKKQRLVYTVNSSRVVSPNDLSVLRKGPEAQITLLTCYPVGTTRSRLIVTSVLTEGQTTGTQQSEPIIGSDLPKPR